MRIKPKTMAHWRMKLLRERIVAAHPLLVMKCRGTSDGEYVVQVGCPLCGNRHMHGWNDNAGRVKSAHCVVDYPNGWINTYEVQPVTNATLKLADQSPDHWVRPVLNPNKMIQFDHFECFSGKDLNKALDEFKGK